MPLLYEHKFLPVTVKSVMDRKPAAQLGRTVSGQQRIEIDVDTTNSIVS